MSDEDLVNALAQYLDLEPLEKQALLEHHSLRTRAESLVELLEIKIIMARTPGCRTSRTSGLRLRLRAQRLKPRALSLEP